MAEIRGIELTRDHIGRRVVVDTALGGFFAGVIKDFDGEGCDVGPLVHPEHVMRYPFDAISWWD